MTFSFCRPVPSSPPVVDCLHVANTNNCFSKYSPPQARLHDMTRYTRDGECNLLGFPQKFPILDVNQSRGHRFPGNKADFAKAEH